MTKIGIIGLGRMGQSIIHLLEAQNEVEFHLFSRLTEAQSDMLKGCNVVIEFTTSEAAPVIIRHCLEAGIPIVSGTTGWQEYHLHALQNITKTLQGKFLHATNFSVGMNIVFALNRKLASIMNPYPQFHASLREIHHIHKKDAPSGTAYTLINDILDQHNMYDDFKLNPSQEKPEISMLPVTALREGEVKGFHEVTWTSASEKITISHEAFDRSIFAQGAIIAAQWLLQQKPGTYTMNNVIGDL